MWTKSFNFKTFGQNILFTKWRRTGIRALCIGRKQNFPVTQECHSLSCPSEGSCVHKAAMLDFKTVQLRLEFYHGESEVKDFEFRAMRGCVEEVGQWSVL